MGASHGLQSSIDQYPIYTGFWINWSRGKVMGATLTLRQSDANLLMAFIALFIAFVTARVWRILCFILHQVYSVSYPQNAAYHQRQAILCNSASPENGARLLFHLLFVGRHSSNCDRFRTSISAIMAIVCICCSTAAGGLSSLISTAVGNEVLLKSANCGRILMPETPEPIERTSAYLACISYGAQQIGNAENYAQQCYSDDSTGVLECGRFAEKNLPVYTDTMAACPFEEEMCRSPSENLRIDTGHIDSHDGFSLNTPTNRRITWRNVLHCAPLATKEFTSYRSTSTGNLTVYNYGLEASGTLNGTYAAQSVESQYKALLASDAIVFNDDYQIE